MDVDPGWMLDFKKELYKSSAGYSRKLENGLNIDKTMECFIKCDNAITHI